MIDLYEHCHCYPSLYSLLLSCKPACCFDRAKANRNADLVRRVSTLVEVDYLELAGLKENSFPCLASVLIISRSHVDTCPNKDCLPPEKSFCFETSK